MAWRAAFEADWGVLSEPSASLRAESAATTCRSKCRTASWAAGVFRHRVHQSWYRPREVHGPRYACGGRVRLAVPDNSTFSGPADPLPCRLSPWFSLQFTRGLRRTCTVVRATLAPPELNRRSAIAMRAVNRSACTAHCDFSPQ